MIFSIFLPQLTCILGDFCCIIHHNNKQFSFQYNQPLYKPIPPHFSFSSFQRKFVKRPEQKPLIGTTDARVACSSVFTQPFSN